jgi:DnaD/phage-associated family protein
MNYIKEINAFYVWLETNAIPPSAINLWHALMNINNKAGWVDEFEVAKSVIEMKTGLKKDAYYGARKILKEKGRIDYRERGVKAAAFKILSFGSYENSGYSEMTSDRPTSSQTSTNQPSGIGISVNSNANELSNIPISTPTDTQNIIKQEKTKPQKNNSSAAVGSNVQEVYRSCFNRKPSTVQMQELKDFINKEGIKEEAVCMAIQKAAAAGASYAYARTILNNWVSKGIKTAKAAMEETKVFQQRKGFAERGTARIEWLPDWYQEPLQQEPVVTLPGADPQETAVDKRARLEELQKKFYKPGSGSARTCRPSG